MIAVKDLREGRFYWVNLRWNEREGYQGPGGMDRWGLSWWHFRDNC